jgi:uncharacterized membrane protein
MLGTIMAANVFFVIIPAHWELIRAKQAGREPDPKWGARGKQRSVHNNYFTLPVLFAMLSNHFSFVYGHAHAWLLLVAFMAIGAWIRHFFNLHHEGRDVWWIPATAAAALIAIAIVLRPASGSSSPSGPRPTDAAVLAVAHERCAPCHSLSPTEPGFATAPAGIELETAAELRDHADEIETVAVQSHVMPPGNATGITQTERDLLARWLSSR